MSAIDFVAPDFAKMLAPISSREETWQEMSREVNALGLTRETFVLAGIEREEQLTLARNTGFVLGQGRALKKPYFPPRAEASLGSVTSAAWRCRCCCLSFALHRARCASSGKSPWRYTRCRRSPDR